MITAIRIPEIHWCREHSMLCTNAGIWNECRLTACNKKWLKEINREKGNNMTNREWLEKQSEDKFVNTIIREVFLVCGATGVESQETRNRLRRWLREEHEEPKTFIKSELIKVFKDRFLERRAIGILEIEELIGELFR